MLIVRMFHLDINDEILAVNRGINPDIFKFGMCVCLDKKASICS